MKRSKFTEQQIFAILKEVEAGLHSHSYSDIGPISQLGLLILSGVTSE